MVGDRAPLPAELMFTFREALYGFVGVRLADYLAYARQISPSWDTVAMPAAEFRRLARPIDEFLLGTGTIATPLLDPPEWER